MSAFGATYRWQVYNNCGQTIAATAGNITVKSKKEKYVSGALSVQSSPDTDLSTSATTATGAVANSATIDNSSNLYLGGEIEFKVVAPASASGNVELWLQHSVDGGVTWPENRTGVLVAVLNFTTNGTKYAVERV